MQTENGKKRTEGSTQRRPGAASSGFSLIEMAVGTLVLGLIAAALIAPYDLYRRNRVIIQNDQTMEIVSSALAAYKERFGYYPCPANPALLPGNINFGRGLRVGGAESACTVGVVANGAMGAVPAGSNRLAVGAVPVWDLNLPYGFMGDAYSAKLTYAVAVPLTNNNAADDNAVAGPGTIDIRDSAGNAVMDRPGEFILVSHGPDRKGARMMDSAALAPVPCGAAALDSENCNGDSRFTDADMASLPDINDANYYDDKVVYMLTRRENTAWMASTGAGIIANRNMANVGIGDNNPTERLDVGGNLRLGTPGGVTGTITADVDVRAARTRATAYFYCDNTVPGDCD